MENNMKKLGFWNTLWLGLTMLGDDDYQHGE
jgi:hypothetical protein